MMDLYCFFCKENINYTKRVVYSNLYGSQTFIYMPENSSAHLECYTKEIFRIFNKENSIERNTIGVSNGET